MTPETEPYTTANGQGVTHGRWVARLAVVAPALCMGLALVLIYRRLVAGWMLAGGDLFTYFFPYWTAAARACQAGRLPLWNPYLFAGAPLLANSQAGIFYPLNWPLWLLSGSTLAGMARTLHWSVLLHLALAAVNAYWLARQLGADRWGAASAGLLYAGSGYLGVQVEHLNQLQGLAWLPLVFSVQPSAFSRQPPALSRPWSVVRGPWSASPTSLLALALILLAGHTQTAFIAVVGLITYQAARWLCHRFPISRFPLHASRLTFPVARFPSHISRLTPYILPFLIAAIQLLPTVELSQLSVRAGGLPWREAVSFSLRPWDLPHAFLPPYLLPPLLPEGVAYLGLVGLTLAAWGTWHALRQRQPELIALIVLAGMGLFLAVGGYNPLYLLAVRLRVPGLVHFRAPARFLALTVLSGALLAGIGTTAFFDRLRLTFPASRRAFYILRLTGCLFLPAELLLSAEFLPHADATVPRAFSDLRPATAHLVAAAAASEPAPGRFLSISQTLFEPGDKPEIESIYGARLARDALWAYLTAAKQREVLAPNLSLAFQVPAVDGYDGGLLPTHSYAAFSRLLLPEATLDGRLRENLPGIPPTRWLDLLNVRFLITDKTGDTWADDIFYDRQFRPPLAPGATLTIGWLPDDFAATAVGLFYQGSGAVEVHFTAGRALTLPLPTRSDETTPYRLRWESARPLAALRLEAAPPGLTLTGATLIDERTGAFYPLVLSDRFRLVHSGDVKIYENERPLPRAFLVHTAQPAADDEAALAVLSAPEFDPTTQVVLSGQPPAISGQPPAISPPAERATIVAYEESHVTVEVHATAPGYLVLTDAWYPGWKAAIAPLTGGPAVTVTPVRADLLFRAVPIEPGDWQITFRYRSRWLPLGAVLSGLGVGLWLWYGKQWAVSSKRLRMSSEP